MGKDPAHAGERRQKRMQQVDDMPPELRACVHDYGLTVVVAITSIGVTKARHVRHIVETVLNEMSPIRGSFSSQGIRTPLVRREIQQAVDYHPRVDYEGGGETLVFDPERTEKWP